MISRINVTLKGAAGLDAPFIGLLDVFGFESFEVNSFEQLCINLANEKLQQLFLRSVFKEEERIYRDEAVEVVLDYVENEGCIALIERIPDGILRLLDEHARGRAAPTTLLRLVNCHQASH